MVTRPIMVLKAKLLALLQTNQSGSRGFDVMLTEEDMGYIEYQPDSPPITYEGIEVKST